jgi:hypothetical protein
MGRSLAMSIRRVVLFALTPASAIGCGNSADSASNSPEAATQVTKADARPNAGPDSELDAPVEAVAVGDVSASDTTCPSPCGFPVVCGPPQCDPNAYDDGGVGSCAPHWIEGDGCNGGHVLFPCGLPTNPLPNPRGTSYGFCATYCMGSEQFNGCRGWADGGDVSGPLGGGGLAYYADAGSTPAIIDCYFDCSGRRPATLLAEPPHRARTSGEALAHAAYLEAASVAAFLDLAVQLEAHGAPRALVRELRRAARDEVRHTRDVAALARARGAEPAALRLADAAPRSLIAIALENAREGCVRETWGAACAVVQSMRATDREIRRTMNTIARDELRHAQLSWDLANWLASRLTPEELARVRGERAHALAELQAELQSDPPEAWRAALGLPTRDEAQAILQAMSADVWVDAA